MVNWVTIGHDYSVSAKSDAILCSGDGYWPLRCKRGSAYDTCLTDNGKLRSAQIATWCTDQGITHQLTAPYTSAQNSCVECMHHTLMDKARSMRITCGAPLQIVFEGPVRSGFFRNFWGNRNRNRLGLQHFRGNHNWTGKDRSISVAVPVAVWTSCLP